MTGPELREWRLGHSMTQLEAARELGMSPSGYADLESGRNVIRDTVKILCRLIDDRKTRIVKQTQTARRLARAIRRVT